MTTSISSEAVCMKIESQIKKEKIKETKKSDKTSYKVDVQWSWKAKWEDRYFFFKDHETLFRFHLNIQHLYLL